MRMAARPRLERAMPEETSSLGMDGRSRDGSGTRPRRGCEPGQAGTSGSARPLAAGGSRRSAVPARPSGSVTRGVRSSDLKPPLSPFAGAEGHGDWAGAAAGRQPLASNASAGSKDEPPIAGLSGAGSPAGGTPPKGSPAGGAPLVGTAGGVGPAAGGAPAGPRDGRQDLRFFAWWRAARLGMGAWLRWSPAP